MTLFWSSKSHASRPEWTLRELQSDKAGTLQQAQDKLQAD